MHPDCNGLTDDIFLRDSTPIATITAIISVISHHKVVAIRNYPVGPGATLTERIDKLYDCLLSASDSADDSLRINSGGMRLITYKRCVMIINLYMIYTILTFSFMTQVTRCMM